MLTFIYQLYAVHVTEDVKAGTTTLNNIKTDWLMRDLEKVWSTTTLTTYMINKSTKSSITVYNFFVPDLYYSIEKIKGYKGRIMKNSEVDKILTVLREDTWYKDYFKPYEPTLDYSLLNQLKYTLLPVQLDALKLYDKKVVSSHLNGYLLAAATGSGKSLMTLALAHCLNGSPVIVVCPKYIINQVWVDNVETQFSGSKKIWKSDDKVPITDKFDYYIFHYEALQQAKDFFKHYTLANPVIILDESHNLNDIKSLRTQTYLDMCALSGSKNIIHASGSAIKAIGQETIPLFRAIDPMFTPAVEVRFKAIYNRSLSRALEILGYRLGMVTHKIDKASVMGAAKPIRREIKIKLPDAARYTLPYLSNELQHFTEEWSKTFNKDADHHAEIYQAAVEHYANTIRSEEERKAFELYKSYIRIIKESY